MQSVDSLSLADAVTDWLANSRHPRILHVFDRACNLINEHREVLSIVTPQIGNGPFNLVLEDDICFSDHLNLESPISISPAQIALGDLTLHTTDAKSWNPHPDWGMLHDRRDEVLTQITQLPTLAPGAGVTNYQFSDSLISSLCSALANADISFAKTITSKLSGLGPGLTPSGDDIIMGAIYAAWIIHPAEVADVLAHEIANTAAPLTTSLSAAWLRSAGKGEAGILWHEFFNALISGNPAILRLQMTKLLSIGHTSGADALAGFIGTFMRRIKPQFATP
ncbi:MAG TPA: DUF2877 domain-containing protein [Anaerolineales bacterium]|nr:DUF2877 domain-containing protein [Anaerolineales bacterium]